MKFTSLLLLASLSPVLFAQSTPVGHATNVSPPDSKVVYAQPFAPGEGPMSSPADGAIVTPGGPVTQYEQDDIYLRQSGRGGVLSRQEEQFQERIQGQTPGAIPAQGIGIPDPLNPNPNVPKSTPTPLPRNR